MPKLEEKELALNAMEILQLTDKIAHVILLSTAVGK